MATNLKSLQSINGLPDAALLDSVSTSLIRLDEAHCVTYMNLAAESMIGLSRDRAAGMPVDELFGGAEEITRLCTLALQTQSTTEIREIELVPLFHPQDHLDVDTSAIPLEQGGILLEIRNIAGRLQIKRDIAMASQSTVSRTIIKQLAHEIKNPLGGLRGAAQLLARRLPTPDLHEYTDVIIHETDRLVDLVDAMLGPRRPTHRKSMNIHRVLDHVGRLIEAEAEEGVRVIRDYDPSLPDALIDEDQMTQALLNLGKNALQAIGGDGEITLRSRAETGYTIGAKRFPIAIRIDVSDSGPGVSEEIREQIFYPLVTGRTEGVGLGLAISLELINRHDGLIKLQRELPTTFSIYLPLESGGS